MERERDARERGGEKDNRWFLQKYVIICLLYLKIKNKAQSKFLVIFIKNFRHVSTVFFKLFHIINFITCVIHIYIRI